MLLNDVIDKLIETLSNNSLLHGDEELFNLPESDLDEIRTAVEDKMRDAEEEAIRREYTHILAVVSSIQKALALEEKTASDYIIGRSSQIAALLDSEEGYVTKTLQGLGK
jgi:hypothetical protein